MSDDFDWQAALDAQGGIYGLAQVERIRAVMATAGIHELPLHPLEEAEAARLRASARRNLEAAAALEARAPQELNLSHLADETGLISMNFSADPAWLIFANDAARDFAALGVEAVTVQVLKSLIERWRDRPPRDTE
jgi:hypothetical protein